MKIIVTKDNIEGGTKAFEIIKKGMEDGDKVLGLATGSSPIPLYDDMCDSDLDFSDMTSINLDEYYGLNPDNDQSYHYFMQKHLFDKKPFKHSYIPNGMAKDIDEEVDRYNDIIVANPIDIQILGIGRNGHIAFKITFLVKPFVWELNPLCKVRKLFYLHLANQNKMQLKP